MGGDIAQRNSAHLRLIHAGTQRYQKNRLFTGIKDIPNRDFVGQQSDQLLAGRGSGDPLAFFPVGAMAGADIALSFIVYTGKKDRLR